MASGLRPGDRLLIATHNKGKVREIRDLIAPLGLAVTAISDLGLPEPEETAGTFEGNAALKARAAALATGIAALADDSGIEIEALGGAPGVVTADWAGVPRDYGRAMQRAHDEIAAKGLWTDAPGPRANFICVLCLSRPDGSIETFTGRVYGHLTWPPRGDKGFGYDPMFVPDGGRRTFGEMEPEAKHAISHRARAFEKFLAAMKGRG